MGSAPAVEIPVPTGTGTRVVRVSNPEKTYFSALPAGTGRKIDLVEYYLAVGAGVLRGVFERPTALKRHPDGADGPAIYQKRVPERRPEWLETVTVAFPSGRTATELCPVDLAHLIWAVNLGNLDFHPWPSRRSDPDRPDELRLDLDPMPGTGWPQVQECAAAAALLLEELGLVGWPKTSGSKGLHVYVRIEPRWPFPQVRRATLAFARELERRHPALATAAWWREERGARVFVDFNRMARDQTVASAYSVRARPVATVSAPLSWSEVPRVHPDEFDIHTMRDRFAARGDVHAGIDAAVCPLEPLLDLVDRHERDHGLGEAPFPPQFAKQPGEPPRVQPSRRRP